MNRTIDISYDDVLKGLASARRLRSEAWTGWIYAAAKAVVSVARIAVTATTTVVETSRRARRRRATIRALSGLSDHTLKDIGLSRDSICSVAIELSASPRPTRPADTATKDSLPA